MKILLSFILRHKFYALIILLILAGGGYFGWQKFFVKSNGVRYATSKVERGVLVSSINGTGQVLSSSQVDIKPKASGNVLNVSVKSGQEVKYGVVIARLDASAAVKAVRDAETNLQSAQLSLEKLKKPADQYSILQAENSLTQARENLSTLRISQEIAYQRALDAKQKAEDALAKAYEDGFNAVSNAFLALPAVMTGLDDLLLDNTIDRLLTNLDWYANQASGRDARTTGYKDEVLADFRSAQQKNNNSLSNYRAVSRYSSTGAIESLILETYATTGAISDAVKSADNFIDFVADIIEQYDLNAPALVNVHQSSLNSYTSTANAHVSNLLTIKNTITASKDSITNASRDLREMEHSQPLAILASERSIREKEESLAKLKAGADPLDIRSQELSVRQRENSLRDARESLADYAIHAPFEGVITNVNVKAGDAASAATAVATLITKQKFTEIALNEVDIAKVKAGQKASLTFDAIDGLNLTGEVAEIDSLGTVTQGVVSYNVKIAFDIQDSRIKPGMSVTANIILDSKPNVLLTPSSAVKTQGEQSYVEVMINKIPERRTVIVGESNDMMTEIVFGLMEGDEVITQTITANNVQSNGARSSGGAANPQMFRMMR